MDIKRKLRQLLPYDITLVNGLIVAAILLVVVMAALHVWSEGSDPCLKWVKTDRMICTGQEPYVVCEPEKFCAVRESDRL